MDAVYLKSSENGGCSIRSVFSLRNFPGRKIKAHRTMQNIKYPPKVERNCRWIFLFQVFRLRRKLFRKIVRRRNLNQLHGRSEDCNDVIAIQRSDGSFQISEPVGEYVIRHGFEVFIRINSGFTKCLRHADFLKEFRG